MVQSGGDLILFKMTMGVNIIMGIPDLFTHTIWVYFGCLKFSHTKKEKKRKTVIIGILNTFWFVCLPVRNMPSFAFFGGTGVSLPISLP